MNRQTNMGEYIASSGIRTRRLQISFPVLFYIALFSGLLSVSNISCKCIQYERAVNIFSYFFVNFLDLLFS